MKILIVGGFLVDHFAPRFYNQQYKLANGFIRNGHTVACFFDVDTARQNSLFRSRPGRWGRAKANRLLVEQALPFAPDLVVSFHDYMIEPSTYAELRDRLPKAKFAQISVDTLFVPKIARRLRLKSSVVDATFVTTAGVGLKQVASGAPAYYLPNMTDPSIETGRAFEGMGEHDIFFACVRFDRTGTDPRKLTLDAVSQGLPDARTSFWFAKYGGGGVDCGAPIISEPPATVGAASI